MIYSQSEKKRMIELICKMFPDELSVAFEKVSKSINELTIEMEKFIKILKERK